MKKQDKRVRRAARAAVGQKQDARAAVRAADRRGKKRLSRAVARRKGNVPGPRPLGRAPVKGLGFFGRIVGYGEKMYDVWSLLWNVRDGRVRPDVPAGRVAVSFVALMLARVGSLNGFEQGHSPARWAAWLGGPRPSADVMGECAASLELEKLRDIARVQHAVCKRGKGFGRGACGLRYLVLDGHEGVASYLRKWEGCLERVVHFAKGDRMQYYFRYVGAYLTNGKERLLLDAEPQAPGEDEIACAMRLLTRVFERYPRAFDVVCGDALYLHPKLWKLVRRHNKHLIAVLKNENRDLMEDARALFAGKRPIALDDKTTRRRCWDLEGFTTWPQCGEMVRVVRSVEQTTVLRQIASAETADLPGRKTGKPHKKHRQTSVCDSEWFWATSLPRFLAGTQTIVRAGHRRWHIENYCFNELSNRWHGDHAYRYDTHALIACTLLLFIAYNLFHAFVERNLKPQARAGRSQSYWARLIAASFTSAFHHQARAA